MEKKKIRFIGAHEVIFKGGGFHGYLKPQQVIEVDESAYNELIGRDDFEAVIEEEPKKKQKKEVEEAVA